MNSWPRFAIVSDFDSVDLSPERERTLTLPHATGATMNLTDRELKCAKCGEMFVFSAGEQEFFQRKGFTNEQKRCKQCKAKRQGGGGRRRIETHVTCTECGRNTTVPFNPTQDKPVLCATCFSHKPKAPDIAAAIAL